MEELGWAGMRIVPTFQGFGSHLQTGVRGAGDSVAHSEGARFGSGFGSRAAHGMREKFSESARYILGPLIGALAVEKIGETIAESIHAASDLEAAQSRSNLIFGKGAEEVDRFGEHAAKSLGLSHLSALQAETGFGLLGQRMGLTADENAHFSERFTGLAADLAAFNHSDPAQAFTALQRGVAGATRGLKPYGLLIDSTSIKAEALADGIVRPVKDSAAIHAAQVRVLNDQKTYTTAVVDHGKASLEARTAAATLGTAQSALNKVTEGAVPPLTQQQKMLAATKLILAQSTTQQGAFKRSSHDLYGEQRKLSASFDNAKDKLGKGLLPVATDFVHALNKDVVPAVDRAATWFEHKGAPAIHDFEHELGPLVHSALPALATGFRDAWHEAKTLLPIAKGIFDLFDGLPGGVQKAIVGAGGAAYLGNKFGLLGRGGAAGGLAGAATLARPIPVFVVNEGFGGVGGKGVPPVVTGAAGATAAEEAAAAAAGRTGVLGRLFGGFFGRGALGRVAGSALSAPALISLGDAGNETGAKVTTPDRLNQLPAPVGGALRDFDGNMKITQSWADLDKTLTHLVKSGNLDEAYRQLRLNATLGASVTGESFDSAYAELDDVLPHVTGKLAKLTAGSKVADRSIRTFGQGVNSTLGDVTTHTEDWRTELGKLPRSVQTKISAPGADVSRSAAAKLIQQYDLTPKQVDTLFRVLGIDEARHEISGLLGMYHAGTPHTGGRTVNDPGFDPSNGRPTPGHSGGAVAVHVHLDKLSYDDNGRARAVVRAEVEADGRFTKQRVEAGSH